MSAKAILDAIKGVALIGFTFWLIIRLLAYFNGSVSPTIGPSPYSNSPLVTESDEFNWKQVRRQPYEQLP